MIEPIDAPIGVGGHGQVSENPETIPGPTIPVPTIPRPTFIPNRVYRLFNNSGKYGITITPDPANFRVDRVVVVRKDGSPSPSNVSVLRRGPTWRTIRRS